LCPWIAGAAAAGAGAAGLAFWASGRKISPAITEATRFRLAPPEGAALARQFTQQSLALSPTGRYVAMIASDERGSMVWVQRLDSLTANPLPGTEGATMVFWSPDGAFIGFWAGGKMKKISVKGGMPLPICDLAGAFSATWNQDNLIVAHNHWPGGSVKISVQSGVVSPGRTLNWPKFLPGGKHLLYVNFDPNSKGLRAFVEELSTGRETALMPTDTQVTFTPDQPGSSQGHLLFGRSATLLALRFDADRLLTTPTGLRKDELTPDDLVVVWVDHPDREAVSRSGHGPSSDLAIHLAVHRERRDIGAVAHAHLPASMGLTLAGEIPDPGALPETALLLPRLPFLALGEPGSEELAGRIAAALAEPPEPLASAVLLERHGAVAVGATIFTDIASLMVLAVCLPIHVAGFSATAGR
jgi:ribulose-5-phosphate 4-epimerase/fuculose-1-phosphate aldolase